jgi:Na+/H+-dicarboxylate symporter
MLTYIQSNTDRLIRDNKAMSDGDLVDVLGFCSMTGLAELEMAEEKRRVAKHVAGVNEIMY